MLSKWDIRMRGLAAIVWLVGELFFNSVFSCLVMTGALILLIILDKDIKVKKVIHQLYHVSPFVILMLVTLSLSGGIPIQKDAVEFALLIVFRVIAAVVIVIALVGDNSVEDFIRSLSVTPIPQIYLSLLLLVNRYVVLLTRDFQKQRMALKSRMFVPKANPLVLKNIGYIIGGMFIRGYDRSEIVYDAMRARCYSGVIPIEEAEHITMADVIKLIMAVLIFAGILCAEKAGVL